MGVDVVALDVADDVVPHDRRAESEAAEEDALAGLVHVIALDEDVRRRAVGIDAVRVRCPGAPLELCHLVVLHDDVVGVVHLDA